jgi:O-succinylhomoserine sulfhydrylase
MSDEDLTKIEISPGLIRYAVGIEDTDDLISDLKAALDSLAAE